MAAPFLSVVVRTDGSHSATFDDLLLALAGQSFDDLEVIVVVVGDDPAVVTRLQDSVDEYHPSFASRVRVVGAAGSVGATGFSAAGNLGLTLARGRYVSILGDDSVPFGHWPPSLVSAADAAAGRVLRVGVASQLIAAKPGYWHRVSESSDAGRTAETVDAYDMVDEPRATPLSELGLLELLARPNEPLSGFAFPRSFINEGERFEEALGSLADWEFLLRSVQRCGVANVHVVGILQRQWDGFVALDVDLAPVLAKLDAQPLVLGPGGASRLAALFAGASSSPDDQTALALEQLRAQVHALSAAQADAEARLNSLQQSTSWRVTAPLRALINRVRPHR